MSQDALEKEVIQSFRVLPPEKKREVLDYLKFLRSRFSKGSSTALKGLWKHLNVDISDQDIAESRREMWAFFPREVEK